jgi:hypothetical protein
MHAATPCGAGHTVKMSILVVSIRHELAGPVSQIAAGTLSRRFKSTTVMVGRQGGLKPVRE